MSEQVYGVQVLKTNIHLKKTFIARAYDFEVKCQTSVSGMRYYGPPSKNLEWTS